MTPKSNLRYFIFALLIAVTILYGCGGSSSDEILEQGAAVVLSCGTVASDGTLSLMSETGVKVVAAESGSLPSEAVLNLVERDIKPEEKSGLGDTYNKVIELSGYKELAGGRQILKTSAKLVTIIIPNCFSADYKKFYVAFRPQESSTWQYQLLPDNGETLITSSRASYAAPAEFRIVTSRLGYCFTIIGDKSVVPVSDIIKTMSFSVVPEDYEIASATLPEERFTADCVFHAQLESEKNSAIFDGIKILTEMTYYSDNTGKSSFKIDGKTNYKEEISDTRDLSYNKYEHKIILDSYTPENFAVESVTAKYSVVFNIKNCLLSEFPDDFRIKVSLTTQEGRVFSNETQFYRNKKQAEPVIISDIIYLKMIEPSVLENVSTSTNIILFSDEELKWSEESHSFINLTLSNFEIVKAEASISEDRTKITIIPEGCLKYGTEYLIDVADGLETTTRGKIIGSSTFRFMTEIATQTLVFDMVTPAEGQLTAVDTNTKIVLRLSEPLDWLASDSDKITLCDTNNRIVPAECSIADDYMTITLSPLKPLRCETDYVVKVSKGLRPKAELKMIQNSEFAFRTCSGNGVAAEINVVPTSMIGGYYRYDSEFIVNFNKPVDSIEKAADKIIVLNGLQEIAFNLQFDSDNTIATLSFAEPLTPGQYIIKMTGAVKDIEGLDIAPFEGDFSFETLPYVSASVITPENSADVATDTIISIGLSETIDWNESIKAEFKLTDEAGNEVPCDKSYDDSDSSDIRVVLTPSEKLRHNSRYGIVVSEAIAKSETRQSFKQLSESFITVASDDSVTVTIAVANEDDIVDNTAVPMLCYNNSSFAIDFVNAPLNREEAEKAIVLYSCDRKVTVPDTHKNWQDNKLIITLPDVEPGELLSFTFVGSVADERNVLYKGFLPVFYRANYFSGRGTEEDPYLVANAAQFDRIRNYMDMGLYFEQTGEIDFTGYVSTLYPDYETKGFKPIGDDTGKCFIGHYNGNNYSIKGLFIDRLDKTYVGIFGNAQYSEFSNIYVNNDHNGSIRGGAYVGAIAGGLQDSRISSCTNEIDVYTDGDSAGGIVGYSDYSSEQSIIEFCENRGFIKSEYGYIGGIAGNIYSAQIISCLNNGSIESDNHSCGGILGYCSEITVKDCKNYGSVTGSDDIGGIAGYGESICVTDSFNYGNVTGVGTLGGILGHASSHAEILRCINNGIINCSGYYFGGIAGYFDGCGTISYCQNNQSVIGAVNDEDMSYGAGGIVGSVYFYGEEMKIENSTNTADVTSGCYAAGIVAFNSSVSIYHCTNSGKITAEEEYAAGIISYYDGEFYLEWCVNTGEINSPYECKQIACLNDWSTVYDSNNTPPFGE